MAIGIDNKPIIDFIFFLLSLKDIYNKNNELYYFKYTPCFPTVLSKRKGTKKSINKKRFSPYDMYIIPQKTNYGYYLIPE